MLKLIEFSLERDVRNVVLFSVPVHAIEVFCWAGLAFGLYTIALTKPMWYSPNNTGGSTYNRFCRPSRTNQLRHGGGGRGGGRRGPPRGAGRARAGGQTGGV